MPRMRLDKLLSHLNCGSRKEVQAMIRAGRVSVDGAPETDPAAKVDPDTACVALDGQVQGYRAQRYYMLNKPAGVITASRDARHDTVLGLFPEAERRGLFAVGRLDKDTEGLLLLTNDGELVNALTHPRHEVEKHYEVRVRGRLDNIPRLAEPMEIDGYAIRPADVVILEQDEQSAKLRLTIHEGRNRQIRKMCEQCGLEVRRLKRVAVGELPLDPKIKSGAWRELTAEELAYLQRIAANLQD